MKLLLKTGISAALTLLAVFLPNTNFAQITVGPQLGISHTAFALDDRDNVETREKALTAGIFANIEFGEWISVQPELSYVRMGGAVSTDLERRTYRVHYLNLPVLAKLSIPIAETFYPHVAAGPYASAKLDANYKYKSEPFATEVNLSDQVRDWDYGGIVSAGLDVRINHFMAGFDVRYLAGFSNISSDETSENYQALKSGSMMAMVRFGYRFGI